MHLYLCAQGVLDNISGHLVLFFPYPVNIAIITRNLVGGRYSNYDIYSMWLHNQRGNSTLYPLHMLHCCGGNPTKQIHYCIYQENLILVFLD